MNANSKAMRRFTIGRERSCDVPIADESVSRVHAEIWLAEDGALMMSDRGSSNGTTVMRAGEAFPLKHDVVLPGDRVRFGGVTLEIAQVIEAVEVKHPGALTPKSALKLPPPPPPPPPPAAGGIPPLPKPAPGALVRCECGAVKNVGQPCPGCHR
jgi:predicted component of type VI protein secretion system